VGPRSQLLMTVLAAAAAGLLGGMLWLWPVLARRGAGFVLLRIAMLGALQASVLGVAFVSVNRAYEFYSSWSDLLGTSRVAGTVVAVGQQRGRPGPAQPPSLLTVPGGGTTHRAPGGRATRRPARRAGSTAGQVVTVRFSGPVSGIKVRGYVYLPPGYRRGSRPLPVIVVISSQAASRTGPDSAPQVAAAAAAQIRAGRMAPALITILPPGVARRGGQGCLDVPGGPQAATFFTQDLPRALAHAYRVATGPSGWAVLGGTGGGYCALQLATAPDGPFGVAVAPPGTYATPPGGAGSAAGPLVRRQDNLLWRLRYWPQPPVRVLFAGPGQARQFQSLVHPPMTVTSARLAAGPVPLAPVLDWVSHALRSPS
jgi:Putative esterase